MGAGLKMRTGQLFISVFAFCGVLAAQGAPPPGPSYGAAARFLEQSSFGPTPATIARVREIGFSKYIDEQFAAEPSPITDPPIDAKGNAPMRPLQDQFFYNAVNGEDQLRQRVAFALHQIWVVSAVKVNRPGAIPTYLRTLQADAFGNFYDLMWDITLNPGMGHYLDMVNNDKPNPKTGKGANENYARELLQLFTLGLYQLNSDGTRKLDAQGNPIPTYDQETIEELGRTFTGWTYAPALGSPMKPHNPANWTGPMVAYEANHDTGEKILLDGARLSAGRSAKSDLEDALHLIFNHPNVGPFIGRQLIQHLVTSNPSPAYIERVAKVFEDNGSGARGDLRAVVKAILLDPEARDADDASPAAGEGHLREPALFIAGVVRALGASVDPTNGLATYSSQVGQNVYFPPTVFNYYHPGYAIEQTEINAPEFEILSTSAAMQRADFVNSLIYGKIAGVTVDLTPYSSLANSPDGLMTAVDNALMRGNMPADMRQVVRSAIFSGATPKAMAQTALYLTASSWQYQVQR
jgi:uncharacterized protein (DUF1800 family)